MNPPPPAPANVTAETNGHEHIKTVIDALEAGGFHVNRIY